MHRLCFLYLVKKKKCLSPAGSERHDEATSRLQPTGPPEISPSSSLCWLGARLHGGHGVPGLIARPSARIRRLGSARTEKRPGTRHLIDPVGPGTCRGFFPTRGRPPRLLPDRGVLQ
jgi:hypothetical protein